MKKILLPLLALAAAAYMAMCAPAHAANCSPFPNTLTNGTTADATQVMADLNVLLNCANNSLAHNGVNSDITQIVGLTTPLAAGQGGTGQSTSIFSSANAWSGVNVFSNASSTFAGNAATSSKWAALMTLNLAGPVTGAATMDGSATVILNTTLTVPVAEFREQQTSGTASSNALVGTTFTTLVLNTTSVNTITGASLASNQVTLPAGTYDVHIVVPVQFNVGSATTQCRLFNVTDTAVVKASSNGKNEGTATHWEMHIEGFFTLAGSKALAVQCWNGQASGWITGPAASNGTETYTVFAVSKIG